MSTNQTHSIHAHTIGSRAAETDGLDVADIAKLVRADVKAARKAGKIPADVKVSVRTSRYSMGQSITVAAVLPDRPARVRSEDPRSIIHERAAEFANAFAYTHEASALSDTLRAIVDAYNWDNSDTMTDYFHSRFHGSVSVSGLTVDGCF